MTSSDDQLPDGDPTPVRNLKRLDRYVVSAPIMIIVAAQLLWPVFGAIPAYRDFPVWRITTSVVASILLAVADLIMVRTGLRVVRAGDYGIPRRLLVWWSVVAIVLIAATAVTPMSAPVAQASAVPLIVSLSLATAWAAVSLAYPLWVAGIGAVILALINMVATAVITALKIDLNVGAGLTLGAFIGAGRGLWILFVVAAVWSSGWMLRVVMELYRSRKLAAELAIAEERLRFSRDLHDVFGRTLATVALKSELAEGLTRRGRVEQAATEMAAVRQLADDTGREIRGLVRGYREADLGRELAGAQTLLDSAGIHCRVEGSSVLEQPGLEQRSATALAWVLREGITNIIRHSRATTVTIGFAGPDPVTMVITNDGSDRSAADPGTGTGLQSMAARLDEVGGSLQYRREDGNFVVTASVPVATAEEAGGS